MITRATALPTAIYATGQCRTAWLTRSWGRYLNELLVVRAVPLGDLGIVQRVLADGANIEHRDGDGNTPLIIAVCLCVSVSV